MSVNMTKQTINVVTTYRADGLGKGKVTAKANGKQRTVAVDHSKSSQAKHALAVGALLNVLCDDRQKSMLRHPSAKSRVRVSMDNQSRYHWTVNV